MSARKTTIFKVPFRSDEGRRLLSESVSQPLLIRLFKKQENNTFCGVHSAAMLMSGRLAGRTRPDAESRARFDPRDAKYEEGNMFDFPETRRVLSFEVTDRAGCNLDEVHRLLEAHGHRATLHRADESGVDEFRSLARDALSRPDSGRGVLLNYDECGLEQDELVRGHFSPVAAYHGERDLFLLLDTWTNTTDVWVGAGDLFRAMNTMDPDSGKSRGYIILEP